jgi:hypothetical protein
MELLLKIFSSSGLDIATEFCSLAPVVYWIRLLTSANALVGDTFLRLCCHCKCRVAEFYLCFEHLFGIHVQYIWPFRVFIQTCRMIY